MHSGKAGLKTTMWCLRRTRRGESNPIVFARPKASNQNPCKTISSYNRKTSLSPAVPSNSCPGRSCRLPPVKSCRPLKRTMPPDCKERHFEVTHHDWGTLTITRTQYDELVELVDFQAGDADGIVRTSRRSPRDLPGCCNGVRISWKLGRFPPA